MRIAINSYPFNKYFHDGPKVFLDRLADSIINQKLAKITSNYSPNYDVALFSVTKTSGVNLFTINFLSSSKVF